MNAYLLDLLKYGRERNASDLHLIAGLPPALRINGDIVMFKAGALGRTELKEMIFESLTEDQRIKLERDLELCIAVSLGEYDRIRITIYYHNGSPELSARICSQELTDSASLGLPSIIDDFARLPSGLVLITGPTGTGKTTTLNYMINLINNERRCKIVTIEDPVEYVHRPKKSLIVQQEVYFDTHSFSRALIHVLRQNPDVIVVGEMRSVDTIITALTAAETGHLVFATLHTPNVMQTMERITGVFDSNMQKQITLQLTNCLRAIIAQDLMPRADGSGRVLAYELLLVNDAVRNIIRENKVHQIQNVLVTARREGMNSMDHCLAELYQKGIISYDCAVSHMKDTHLIKPGS